MNHTQTVRATVMGPDPNPLMRSDKTTDDRSSWRANFQTMYQALLGSGPPDRAWDRFEQIRMILSARDDDAALALVAVYETYLSLARRQMRAAAWKAIAALALGQLLVIGMGGYAVNCVVDYASAQNRETVNVDTAVAARQALEKVYGDETMRIAAYLTGDKSRQSIVIASSRLVPDDLSRLERFPL